MPVERFVVVGAGAIGGLIGGRLHEAGTDVLLVARGAHGAAIRASGLRIDDPDRSVVVSVPSVPDPAAIEWRPGDVVVLAVKAQDTEHALDDLRTASLPTGMPIVCAQNGVESERRVLRRYPNVYGVCVMCPAGHLEPGVVTASSAPVTGLLDIGRYPAGVDDVAREIAAAFSAATFESEARADIMRWKHQKLVMNVGNAVDALCPPGDAAKELVRAARREALACLTAAGVDVASDEEDRARRGDRLSIRPIGDRERGSSSWQSLARGGGSIESDFLNGEVSLLGRLHGVPTPVNDLLAAVAFDAARNGVAPRTIPAEDLAARLPVRVPEAPARRARPIRAE